MTNINKIFLAYQPRYLVKSKCFRDHLCHHNNQLVKTDTLGASLIPIIKIMVGMELDPEALFFNRLT